MDLKYIPIKVIRGHDGSINVIKFSSNGRYLASGGDEGIVKIWHVADMAVMGGLNSPLAEYSIKNQAIHNLMWLQAELVSDVYLIIAARDSLVVLALDEVRL